MRRFLNAAVRAAFSYVLGPVAAVVWICGLSAAAQESHAFDGKTLVLHGYARKAIATIVYGPRVEITIDPEHRFQWARDEGAGYRDGSRVTRDFNEVIRERLGAPARRIGWRDPFRIDRYFLVVNQYTGPELSDGRIAVDVRANARGDFLIVVTSIFKPTGVTP